MSLVQKAAPDFSADAVMPDGQTAKLTLSSFKGKKYVVLFFYPFDFTFVCPTEILGFSNHIAEFEKRNVQVIGCSIDSPHVHRAWRSTKVEDGGIGAIKYPLVADVNKTIAREYGVLLEGGMALRGTFLIDKAGVVRQSRSTTCRSAARSTRPCAWSTRSSTPRSTVRSAPSDGRRARRP